MAGPAVAARPVEVEVLVMEEDGPEPVRVLVSAVLVELCGIVEEPVPVPGMPVGLPPVGYGAGAVVMTMLLVNGRMDIFPSTD